MPTVTTPIQKARKLGKKKKYIPFGKEEVPSLFAEDMILYIENPKDSTLKNYYKLYMNAARLQDTKSIYKICCISFFKSFIFSYS